MSLKTQPGKAEPKQHLQVFVIDSEESLSILNGVTAKRILHTKTKRVINFISLIEDSTLKPLTKTESFNHGSSVYSGKHEIIRKISVSDYKNSISKKLKFPALDKLVKALKKEERETTVLVFRKSVT
jgi:hypothetical protein